MSRGDPVALDQARYARRDDQHVGASTHPGEVAGARVAHRDGGVLLLQQQGDGLADERAASHHDGVGALELDSVVLENAQDTEGGAGGEAGLAL